MPQRHVRIPHLDSHNNLLQYNLASYSLHIYLQHSCHSDFLNPKSAYVHHHMVSKLVRHFLSLLLPATTLWDPHPIFSFGPPPMSHIPSRSSSWLLSELTYSYFSSLLHAYSHAFCSIYLQCPLLWEAFDVPPKAKSTGALCFHEAIFVHPHWRTLHTQPNALLTISSLTPSF